MSNEQNTICCTCLQAKPLTFHSLSSGGPGQPTWGMKVASLSSSIDYGQIANAIICDKCSYFLDQSINYKKQCETTAERLLSYMRRISADKKRVHFFSDSDQAAGSGLVLHKLEDTINGIVVIMGVASKDTADKSGESDSDSSVEFVCDNAESERIDISDDELLEPLSAPNLTVYDASPEQSRQEYTCPECTLTFFTIQNLKRHKAIHDQALDIINQNIHSHMITAGDIRSIIGLDIADGTWPTITYTEVGSDENDALLDHTYFSTKTREKRNKVRERSLSPPVLSPQTETKTPTKKGKIPILTAEVTDAVKNPSGVSLYRDLITANCPVNNGSFTPPIKTGFVAKPRKKALKNDKKNILRRLKMKLASWKYNPKVVLLQDDELDARVMLELTQKSIPAPTIQSIPQCVHSFLDDTCRTKTTLLLGNLTAGLGESGFDCGPLQLELD